MIMRIIFSLLLGFTSAAALAASSKPIQIADNAPDSYTVQRGDTLWGISGKFLKEPWRWPEVWCMNRDQIRNPHLIYPGQIVVLDRNGPRLSIARPIRMKPQIYDEKLQQAIPSIPTAEIAPVPVATAGSGRSRHVRCGQNHRHRRVAQLRSVPATKYTRRTSSRNPDVADLPADQAGDRSGHQRVARL